MSHRFSEASQKYLAFQRENGLTEQTLDRYSRRLKLFFEWANDPFLEEVTAELIDSFLKYLSTEHRITHGKITTNKAYSPQMVKQFHSTLRDFLEWAGREYGAKNPISTDIAIGESTSVNPFSNEEVYLLLEVCNRPIVRNPSNRRLYLSTRSTALRDKAILMVLLNTGIMAVEICRLKVSDFDRKKGRLFIKGKLSRNVPLSIETQNALNAYLNDRYSDQESLQYEPLFSTQDSTLGLSTNGLQSLLHRLAEQANIRDIQISRFRDTFAINFLLNGGRFQELADILGVRNFNSLQRYAENAPNYLEKGMKRHQNNSLLSNHKGQTNEKTKPE